MVGRLRLDPDLEPGAYTLEVALTDPKGGRKHRTARQWAEFEIVHPQSVAGPAPDSR